MSAALLSIPDAADAPTRTPPDLDIDAATTSLVVELERTAVERDRAGGHAAAERERVRASGLLAISIPRAHGGLGVPWTRTLRVVRRIAEVDSAIAHVFGFHHLQVASVLLHGTDEQQRRLLRQTIAERLFWGNALNPLDRRLVATPVDGGFRLDGTKSYASGALGSDRLTLSAHLAPGQEGAPFLIGTVATRSAGIAVRGDWDGFGQRQTDSGTVTFDHVFLPEQDVLQPLGRPQTPRATLRTLVSQAMMANLYLGLARGAFDAALRFVAEYGRPPFGSTALRPQDDPYLQHRVGQLKLLVRPAEALADAAGDRLQAAFDRGERLDAAERGETAIAVSEAKVLAHRASVEVGSQLFELTGARSTSGRFGLDRFWRNARVHTLHDPVDYKLRDIGRHALTGDVPVPTPYS